MQNIISQEFIDRCIRMFFTSCKHAIPINCEKCTILRFIIKNAFNDHYRKENIEISWEKDMYPKFSIMTLSELSNLMFKVKTYAERRKIKNPDFDLFLFNIDREIKMILSNDLKIIKEQLNDINDNINLIKDWLMIQKNLES
jgi:hypothetical protein